MKKIIILSITLTLLQCTGCINYTAWRRDVNNSKQTDRYTSAINKRMNVLLYSATLSKTSQPMVSLYDEVHGPPLYGKGGTHRQRWVTLFADGSFCALNYLTVIQGAIGWKKDSYATYFEGQWEKGEGTMVVLKRPDGTSPVIRDPASSDMGLNAFSNVSDVRNSILEFYIPIDLASVTNFPPSGFPLKLIQLYETRSTSPEDMN